MGSCFTQAAQEIKCHVSCQVGAQPRNCGHIELVYVQMPACTGFVQRILMRAGGEDCWGVGKHLVLSLQFPFVRKMGREFGKTRLRTKACLSVMPTVNLLLRPESHLFDLQKCLR